MARLAGDREGRGDEGHRDPHAPWQGADQADIGETGGRDRVEGDEPNGDASAKQQPADRCGAIACGELTHVPPGSGRGASIADDRLVWQDTGTGLRVREDGIAGPPRGSLAAYDANPSPPRGPSTE